MTDLKEAMGEWDAAHFAASKRPLKPTLNRVRFDEDKLTLVLMGDTHIGSRHYDSDLHMHIYVGNEAVNARRVANNKSRPTVRKVKIECEVCSNKGHIYFTNQEIWDHTTIEQQCKKCNKFTVWRLLK